MPQVIMSLQDAQALELTAPRIGTANTMLKFLSSRSQNRFTTVLDTFDPERLAKASADDLSDSLEQGSIVYFRNLRCRFRLMKT